MWGRECGNTKIPLASLKGVKAVRHATLAETVLADNVVLWWRGSYMRPSQEENCHTSRLDVDDV